MTEKPDAMETRRDGFLGVYGSPAKPEAVVKGQLSGTQAHGWQVVGAMQFDITLEPWQEKSILLGLGYFENPEQKWEDEEKKAGAVNKEKAKALMRCFADPEEMTEYSVIRRYRGGEYRIHVINPNHVEKGVREIRVNGRPIKGNLLPIVEPGGSCDVEVMM